MKISVLIPAYNESKSIGELIRNIRQYIPDLLVVDDGSTDQTTQLAIDAGAEVITNSKNHGKGISLRQGFEAILKGDAEWILTMDGDGQHSPEDIPQFLNEIKNNSADLVIGNRMSQKGVMPWDRWMTNKAMSSLISRLIKEKVPDTQCGFRMIRREVLEQISLKSYHYEVESELLIEAARAGFKLSSVPIQTIYTGQTSQIKPFTDTLRFFRLLSGQSKNK